MSKSLKLVLSIIVLFCFKAYAQDLNYSVIDQNVIDLIESDPENDVTIYLILEDKVDLDKVSQQFRAASTNFHERAVTLNRSLRQKAADSQVGLKNDLLKMRGVDQQSIRSFWIANAIFLKCDKASLAKISNDPRIEWIGLEGKLKLTEAKDSSPSLPMSSTIQTGLEVINAPALWELGYTGYGQIALVADTGIDPTHPAYSERYRGYTTENSQAWFTGDFFDTETPFVCGDHGSHVLGTVLGLDKITQDTIGVAFGAQWMGSPNLCGGGTGSNIATFEWAADPDGDPNTTEDIADVINNSWWDPSSANSECNSLYADVLEALELMGVAVVFSAGNAGPEDQTITPPKNINFDVVNSFTVAALSGSDPELLVANFSSRGPSDCGGEGSLLIKPEVAAPGVSVRSSELEGTYGFKSGTSMAAPHVSGAILLLKEAFPFLGGRDFKLALYHTCTDLGEEGEDNTYGMGVINVKAAYDYLIDQGHEPVPPLPANDIVLLDISTDKFECDNEITPQIIFFNDSEDVLESVQIQFIVDDNEADAVLFDWEGILEPRQSESIIVPGFEAEQGIHTLTAVILSANGEKDARTLNNRIKKNVQVSANEQIRVFTDTESFACQDANTLLTSDYAGDGEVHWFTAPTRGGELGVGNQISLPSTDEPYLVYADIQRTKKVGETESEWNSNNGDVVEEDGYGIMFNAFHPFVIESYKIYSEDSGFFIVQLVAGNDDIIFSDLVRSDGSGWQTIDGPIVIRESRNLRLLKSEGPVKLARKLDDLNYPYMVQDIMEISASIIDGDVERFNFYNYFFDFEISHFDVCGRTPIEVLGVETDSIPVAEIVLENESNAFDVSEALVLTDASTNAVERIWDFGDGNTSDEISPSHNYEEGGIYYVSLTVFNEDGCYDSQVIEVEVIPNNLNSTTSKLAALNEINVYPNPVKDALTVRVTDHEVPQMIKIYNNKGQLVMEQKDIISNETSIIVDGLVPGLYYINAIFTSSSRTQKFIKH